MSRLTVPLHRHQSQLQDLEHAVPVKSRLCKPEATDVLTAYVAVFQLPLTGTVGAGQEQSAGVNLHRHKGALQGPELAS